MLTPIGWLYGKIADVRNSLYDRGTFPSHDLGARTISIGNITTGGTGKTPLVARVAEILAGEGEKVCILTRGYGREDPRTRVLVSDGKSVIVGARTGGDEPVELAQKLIGKAVVVADADRVAAAAWAIEKYGVTAFILDDGFQHRRARRDLDIVCIDATDPFGNELVLPAGRLREPLHNLARADAIVITRSNLVDDTDAIAASVRRWNVEAPLFASRNELRGITILNGGRTAVEWSSLRASGSADDGVRILAFCGLGNPEAFFTELRRALQQAGMHGEFDLAELKEFPDHHRYSQSDITTLEQHARDTNVHALLTTAKDAVKLESLNFSIPCFVVANNVVIEDADAFRRLITSS